MSKRFAINTVVQIGGLTRDPELRSLAEGGSVCKLRLAVDGMGPGGESGYIDVDVFGKQAEPCAHTYRRAAKSRSRAAWPGASGRPRTAVRVRATTSSPTACSSSAAAAGSPPTRATARRS